MQSLSPATMVVFQASLTQGHLTAAELAKQLGLRPHTVRRALDTLKEKQILKGIRPYVNPYLLGLNEYYLYFTVQDGRTSIREAFINALCKHEQVSYVGEVGGDYQFEVRLLTRDARGMANFMDEISDKFQSKVTIASMCLTHEEEYSSTFLGESKSSYDIPSLSFSASDRRVSIGELDHKILSLFAVEGIETAAKLARTLGVPTTTVSYRLSRMHSSGLIPGYYRLCDGRPLGLLPIVFLIAGGIYTKKQRVDFLNYCRVHKNICVTNMTTGPWQSRLLARVREYSDVMSIIRGLSETFPINAQSIRVLPQLNFYKVCLYPFRNFKSIAPA